MIGKIFVNRHTDQRKYVVGTSLVQATVALSDNPGDLENADIVTYMELKGDWEEAVDREARDKQEKTNAECLDLLMRVVTLGRNGMPYRKMLPRLRRLVRECPGIASVIRQVGYPGVK